LCFVAISWIVRSPRNASSTTRALKSAVAKRYCRIHLRQSVEYTLATCPIFRDHLKRQRLWNKSAGLHNRDSVGWLIKSSPVSDRRPQASQIEARIETQNIKVVAIFITAGNSEQPRPDHPPCPYPGDERRELSSQPKPKTAEIPNNTCITVSAMVGPVGPSCGLPGQPATPSTASQKVVWFCSAQLV
jgi:hypothetical protein